MAESLRVLVVDDFEPDRKVFARILRDKGCGVDTAVDYTEAIEKLSTAEFDVVLIDLKIPNESGEQDPEGGVKLLQEIRRRNIRVGIIVLTGQTKSEVLLRSLKETEQLGYSSFLVKDRLIGLQTGEEGADELFREVQKAANRRLGPEEIVRVLEIDPFVLTYERYLKLESHWVADVQRRAREAKEEWALERLRAERARWLVLCGDRVVRQSGNMQELPGPKELDEIGRETNLVPFVFIRMSENEEVCRAEIPWQATRHPGDFYPSIDIIVKGSNGTRAVLCADLDTGSPEVHLNLEELLERGVITASDLAECKACGLFLDARPHLGRSTPCYWHTVEIGTAKTGSTPVLCEFIERWTESGFHHANVGRKALAGRPLLLQLRVRLELDGKNRVTRVLPPENPVGK